MPRKEKLTPAQVIEAINTSFGLQTIAAKKLHCSRETVDNYANKYPLVKQAIKDNQEFVLDVAESKLFQLVNSGDLGAICFLLKTKGRFRGYIERQDVDVTSKGNELKQTPIFNIINPDTRILLQRLESGEREPQLAGGPPRMELNNNIPQEPISLPVGQTDNS
jgi:hypothetical protein